MMLYQTRFPRLSAVSIAVAATIGATVASGTASAGGFSLVEHGVSGLGNAYAGAAAVSADGSTAWFNAAGMTELGEREISVAAHILVTDTEFTNAGTALNAAFGSADVSGDDTADPSTTTVLPNLYYTAPLGDSWHYGLSIGVPYGSSTEYDDDWVGRYTTIESSIAVIDINPSVAYQFSDSIRFGGGISVQFLDAELSSAIDSGAVCLGVFGDASPETCLDTAALVPGDVTRDGLGEISGDSVGVGFNLGLLFLPTPSTKIGLAFRSGVDHSLDGEGDFTTDEALRGALDAAGVTVLTDTGASADVSLPATVALSGAQKLGSKWELLADITWTDWSVLDELRIEFDNEQQPDSVTALGFEDAVRVSAGLNYDLNDKVRLRGGIAWDEEAITGPDTRTARIPGNDRTWLSVGLGYKVSDRLSFDLGYTHIMLEETAINNANLETAGGTFLRGTFDSSVNIFGAQLNWNFL